VKTETKVTRNKDWNKTTDGENTQSDSATQYSNDFKTCSEENENVQQRRFLYFAESILNLSGPKNIPVSTSSRGITRVFRIENFSIAQSAFYHSMTSMNSTKLSYLEDHRHRKTDRRAGCTASAASDCLHTTVPRQQVFPACLAG